VSLEETCAIARSYADAPEIDGVVHLLPPDDSARVLKVGEFVDAEIIAVEGHDLVAVPVFAD
jgi:ribosomal protein S12 methylthiotransferase